MQPIAIRVYSERSFIRHRPLTPTTLCHTKQQVRSQKISISNPRKWGSRILRKKASSQHIYINLPVTPILTAKAHRYVKVTEILLLFLELGIWVFMNGLFLVGMKMSSPEIYWPQKVFFSCVKAFLKVF